MAGMKLRQRVLGRYPKWYRVFFVQCVEIRIDLVKVNIAVSSMEDMKYYACCRTYYT